MHITAARLYHPAPWGWLYSYRVIIVALRMLELEFKVVRYLFFRAPLLVAWTRLPVLRDRRPPYGTLAEVLAPPKERPSLLVGEGLLGSNLFLAQGSAEVDELMKGLQAQTKPPSRIWSVFGCILRGYYAELGPAFVKFGQIMSMRQEIPPTVRRELQLLQDKLPPMSYKEVRRILERELDRPVDEVFEWVEETPIASASLAQVHRAKLRREQEEVALKIQRPHLDGIISLDTVIICDIIVGAIRLALPLFRKNTDVGVFTSSYRKSLKREVDFVLEARTQDEWRRRIEKHPLYGQVFKIARTYTDYTTTKLLTMELVKDLYRFDRIFDDLTPEEIWAVVSTKVDGLPPELTLQLFHVHGFMVGESMCCWDTSHGDIHLGNLYLVKPREEGEKWRIFVCDFGMMIESPGEERDWLSEMFASMTYYRDGNIMVHAFERAGTMEGMPQWKMDEMRRLARFAVQNYAVPLEEGKEVVLHPIWQRGSATNLMASVLYNFAQMGVKWSDWWWLVLKNIDYMVNIGATLSSSMNWTEPVLTPARWWVKKEVLNQLEGRDITNFEDSLDDILAPLREYDREQVLNCLLTGEDVKPLERSWMHTWDLRFGMK
jgi:hypothetical protein